jgi:hypothetical protein
LSIEDPSNLMQAHGLIGQDEDAGCFWRGCAVPCNLPSSQSTPLIREFPQTGGRCTKGFSRVASQR